MTAAALEWWTPLAAALALGALWLAEGLAPLWAAGRARVRHAVRNATMGIINAGVRALFLPGLLLGVTGAARDVSFGLLNLIEWVWWVELLAAMLLLDFWGYLQHVVAHHVPLLWRFHAVHHHDAQMDSTTAFRFHAGEIVVWSLALLAAVPVLGLSMFHVLAYEVVLILLSLFHHANLRLPRWLDRGLRWIIVTPSMHIVHHSRWHVETDSNFGPVLSVWDRLCGTLRISRNPGAIRPGLDGYRAKDHSTLRGMLATPLAPIRSEPGRPPEGQRVRHVHSGDARVIPRPRHFRAQ